MLRAGVAASALRRMSLSLTRSPAPARQEPPLRRRALGPAAALGALVMAVALSANLQFAPPTTPRDTAVISAYVAPQQAAAAPLPIAPVAPDMVPTAPIAAVPPRAPAALADAMPVMTRLNYAAPPVRTWEQHKQFAVNREPPAQPSAGFELIPIKLMQGADDAAADDPAGDLDGDIIAMTAPAQERGLGR
jgi:hypothetical protein